MSILYTLGVMLIMYLAIGLILGFVWFALAKIVEMDNRSEYWGFILNSAIGLLYFLMVVLVFWLPALIPIGRQWGQRLKFNKERVPQQHVASPSLKSILGRPYYTLKEHIFNWYYSQ
ncbi:hypothetical protein [Paenibacillus sp. Y412MC10]|uniref:hypothetical protein n=1 Tax=Geobacillus sp. (strain Y412MC10) TaxID=481743 RepID=UPI0011AB3C2A|nr:hypothetical protein [Paenibacillus sp. Y412MC10]